MNAYLRPLVSCCLYTTIIRLKKKDFFSTRLLSYKDGMKPVVVDKLPSY